MTPAARLRQHAERLSQEARDLMALADQLDYAPVRPPPSGPTPAAATSPQRLLPSHCVTIKALAANLRVTEKTARKIARDNGAEVRVGGRRYYDQTIIAQGTNYRVLPVSSLSDAGLIADANHE